MSRWVSVGDWRRPDGLGCWSQSRMAPFPCIVKGVVTGPTCLSILRSVVVQPPGDPFCSLPPFYHQPLTTGRDTKDATCTYSRSQRYRVQVQPTLQTCSRLDLCPVNVGQCRPCPQARAVVPSSCSTPYVHTYRPSTYRPCPLENNM